jgi:hypothetical protein
MIEFLPQSHDNFIAIKVGGTLTARDYERELIPKLDELLSKNSTINILFVMDETFSGWSMNAAWDDATYALKHRAQFDRIAVVGGPAWVGWCMRAGAFLMSGEIRSFASGELESALQWVDPDLREGKA